MKTSTSKLDILPLAYTNNSRVCLLRPYTKGSFIERPPVIGIDYYVKAIKMHKKNVTIYLWNTTGTEKYKEITYMYYNKVQGSLLLFDVSNRSSFDEIPVWISEIHKRVNREVIIYLVASKIDIKKGRVVTKEEGQSMAKRYNIKYFETPAKENINITEAIEGLAESCL